MIRFLLMSAWAVLGLGLEKFATADDLRLSLDLRNTYSEDPMSGGTWGLYVRSVDTGTSPEGAHGVASIRAILTNVASTGITFSPGFPAPNTPINANGAAEVQVLSNGTVEIVYSQDTSADGVVTSVGTNPRITRETLVASGSWPAGPRPTFGVDPQGLSSSGSFLSSDVAPYSAVPADTVVTSVVTLGDLNGSLTINNLDTPLFVARLPGGALAGQFHPAADINQDGFIRLDISGYVAILFARKPGGPTTVAVPEPVCSALIGFAMFAVCWCRGISR